MSNTQDDLIFTYTPDRTRTVAEIGTFGYPFDGRIVKVEKIKVEKFGPKIPVKRLPHYPVDPETEEMYPAPNFATDYSAAVDLRSAAAFDVVLSPNESYVFPTGLCYNMMYDDTFPFRIASIILPRSGMGFKLFTRLANTVGLIDQDYQKEIMVKVRNEGTEKLTIKMGERFCQMMFVPVLVPKFVDVDEFDSETERGGFGSTGTN
ncbi:deoxyuridine 5'-triphosphate nucleotidohydrolase [Vibrio phage vB_VmeM-32]|nr:deoxyuridine 5'-triphosphate nucleotidohydrolase [Vibrio phage vB_VmeM-32]